MLKSGKPVEEFPRADVPDWVRHTVRIGAFGPEMFRIPWTGGEARVIGVVPGQIVTDSLVATPPTRAGEALPDAAQDLAKIAVVERHLGTGRVGLGFVRGFGLQRGAIASTVAHDAHNVVVVGMNDASMAAAVRRLANRGGGIVVVDGAEVLAELPLPVAGLLSDAPLEEVVAAVARARRGGARRSAARSRRRSSISRSSRSRVIPSLKITDRGLVDVDRFELVRWCSHDPRQRLDRHDGRRRHRARARLGARRGRSRRRGRRGRRRPTAREDLGGAVVTPGLVNTHHHLYQTLTRARAQEADLFTWLKTLYPTWARIDDEMEYAAARCGLAELALSGCTTVFDHHYVFPRGVSGLVEAEIRAAQELGVRIVASRGSMDLGESDGGLPPDSLVEDIDTILADTERLHALADGAMVQIAVAPCSPFSVTTRLMEESAALARRLGLQLHTHLAETVEEDAYCRELFGCTPVEYLERVGWIADDVWCAHCVHLSDDDVADVRAGGRRRRALPDVEPATRRRRRAGARRCSTRACASASASTAARRTSAATSSSR